MEFELTFALLILKSVKLSMLVDLKLHSCEGITSASMAAIAQSRLLEVGITLLSPIVFIPLHSNTVSVLILGLAA